MGQDREGEMRGGRGGRGGRVSGEEGRKRWGEANWGIICKRCGRRGPAISAGTIACTDGWGLGWKWVATWALGAFGHYLGGSYASAESRERWPMPESSPHLIVSVLKTLRARNVT